MHRPRRTGTDWITVGGLLLLALFGTGCVYVPPDWEGGKAVHQTETIVKGVTTKQEILQRFGAPQLTNSDLNVLTYRETSQGGVFCLAVPGRKIYGTNYYTVSGGCKSLSGDTRGVRIFFDDQDRVLDLVSWGVSDDDDVEELADGGDADAQYRMAVDLMHEGETESGLLWMCRALHGGNYKALSFVADQFRDGWPGDEPDLVQAYAWYSLADAKGSQYGRLRRKALRTDLNDGQVAEADDRAANWTPDPAACDRQDTRTAFGL